MFTFRELISEICNTGYVPYDDEPIVEGNTAFICMCSSPDFSTFVTVILENDNVFLLKHLLYLPVAKNTTSILILQQQANMQLDYGGFTGRVCLDTAEGDGTEDETFALMYSLVVPVKSLDVSSVATLLTSACGAIEMLSSCLEEVEERIVEGVLPADEAFLVPVGEDENVEISLHPAMQLMQIEANQRKEFLSFLSAHNITLEEFTQAKQLDLFFVVTDNIAVNISNGRGGCWEIDKIAIRRKTNAELEELVLPSYNLYVSGCRLLGIPPRSLDSVLWDIKYYI